VVPVIPRQLRPETDEEVYLNGQQSTHFSFDRNSEVQILCRFKARKRQFKRALSNGTCFSCKLAVVSLSSLAMYVSEHTPWVIGLAKFGISDMNQQSHTNCKHACRTMFQVLYSKGNSEDSFTF
jgi:hypothetical protein